MVLSMVYPPFHPMQSEGDKHTHKNPYIFFICVIHIVYGRKSAKNGNIGGSYIMVITRFGAFLAMR